MYFYGKKRGKNKLLNKSELKFDKKLGEVVVLLAFYVKIKVFLMFFPNRVTSKSEENIFSKMTYFTKLYYCSIFPFLAHRTKH